MHRDDNLVDQPYAGKWHDDSSETIDQQIARQHLARADWLILHTSEGQRNQSNDD